MRYEIKHNECSVGCVTRVASDAGGARLNRNGEGVADRSYAQMSDMRFTALCALAEVIREIHEELLAEGINILESSVRPRQQQASYRPRSGLLEE